MACGLPRRNTVKTILRGSCYEVQEPWDLALFTQTCYMKLAKIKLPFLEEIGFGSPMHLKICKTKKRALLPSAESIKSEREYEMKRLSNLKCQEDTAKKIQFSLRKRQVGLRRPLSPSDSHLVLNSVLV